jgi:hypothetical protein
MKSLRQWLIGSALVGLIGMMLSITSSIPVGASDTKAKAVDVIEAGEPINVCKIVGAGCCTDMYVVPEDARFHIDFAGVGTDQFLQAGELIEVHVETTAAGTEGKYLAGHVPEIVPSAGDSRLMKLYADPGTTVKAATGVVIVGANPTTTLCLSGRLVPVN